MSDINIGKIMEALNDKADRDLNNVTPPPIYVVETGHNADNTQFYRLWNDNFCEMWGIISDLSSAKVAKSIDFLKTLKNYEQASVNFACNAYSSTAPTVTDDLSVLIYSMTNSSMSVQGFDSGGNNYTFSARWEVKGYVI